jgi:hypothetical protein
MNPVGEGGNQSSITAPTSVADVPSAIGGMEPVNPGDLLGATMPDNLDVPKIPGDASAAEAKVNEAEKNVLDALKTAAQTGSSLGILTEDPPPSPIKDYLAKFGDKPNQIGEETKIDLSPESPTLTNVNQPQSEASTETASSRSPVTLNDLLTKGPQAVFNEPVPAAPEVGKVPQPENLQTAVENTVPETEVMPQIEKTPKEKIMEEFSKILDNYSVKEATEKVPA